MKVGILTYHSSDNYGSVLQAYALQKFLSRHCNCEIIDYRKKDVKKLYSIFKPLNSAFNIATNIHNFINLKKLIKRKNEFERFRKNEIALSKQMASKKTELCEMIGEYEALVCGSDQVWNFDIIDFDTSYMLDFAGFNGKKISYAASLGPVKKEQSDIAKYAHLLNDFDYISVREKEAKEVLCEIIDKNVDILCDPVFLLDKEEWEQIANKSSLELYDDYIFCYFPGGVSQSMEEFSRDLARKNNCKRILIINEWRNLLRPGEKFYECSPYDFVKLIKNAKYVCTTSFHGTAFSTIMGTKFFVESGTVGKMDSRIDTLLGMTNNFEAIINYNADVKENLTYTTMSDIICYSKKIIESIV